MYLSDRYSVHQMYPPEINSWLSPCNWQEQMPPEALVVVLSILLQGSKISYTGPLSGKYLLCGLVKDFFC